MLSAKNMMMRRVLYSLNRFLYCDVVYSFPFSFSNNNHSQKADEE